MAAGGESHIFFSDNPDGSRRFPFGQLRPKGELLPPLSPSELVTITFYSFYFSQGKAPLQQTIIDYIASKAKGRVSLRTVESTFGSAVKRMKHFAADPSVHTSQGIDPGSVQRQVDLISELWSKALHRKRKEDPVMTRHDLRQGIITRDLYYLTLEGGRPRSAHPADPQRRGTTYTDQYMSQFVHFGMLGRRTPHPLYDEMFRDIEDDTMKWWSGYVELDSPEGDESSSRRLLGTVVRDVARIHFDHHPGDFEALSPEWRAQLDIKPRPISLI